MEPDVMPMHSSSPPPLDDDVEEGAEDEEFGDFGSFSVGVSSTLSFSHFTQRPSSLSQPCPATHLPSSSFNNPVEQYQPASTVTSGVGGGQIEIKGKHCNANPPLHLTNGYPERDRPSEHSDSGTKTASVTSACSVAEETGFADFPAFPEQAVHPWCCGFSPVGGGENWDGRAAGTNLANSLGESQCDSRQEIDVDSGSHTAKEKAKDCTKVKHCEQRDATLIQSSQDHLPQDPAALAPQSEECYPGEEELVDPGVSQRERRLSPSANIKPPQTNQTGEELQSEEEREDGEESVSPLPHTSSESVSEDFASFCDVVSPEEVSEDFDPSLSSPALQEDEAEDLREGTDEEEDSGNLRHAVSITSQAVANLSLSQSEAEEGFAQFDKPEPTLQEASPDFIQSEWRTDVEEDFTDFKQVGSGDHRDQDHDQRSNAADQGLTNLPPSDSFADFCSAPTEEGGKGCWEAFRDPSALTEGKTWTPFGEEDSAKNTESDDEEERDRGQGDDLSRRDRGQGDDSSRRDRGQGDDSSRRDRGQGDDSSRRDRGQGDDSSRDRGQGDDLSRRDGGQGDDLSRDRGQGDDSSRRDGGQGSLASRVQRLFQASFPDVAVQQVVEDEENEVPSLSAVLQVPDNQLENGQEERPGEQQLCPTANRVQWAMWRQHQDIHNAVGLKFQWGGSHSNRSLLRCLGIDTRNIVFSGQTKQPVIVPAFASNLGMLKPTKEPVAAVGTPGQTRVTAQGPLGPRDGPRPSIDSMQETLPSSRPAWSSSGLSNSQDGSRDCTGLNLDYFGPVEDVSSSSSRSNSPPPGVDRELYELTVTKLEASVNSSHLEETFNRLMSTVEKTSSSVRKPQREELLSQEAVKVIGDLPSLSFMQAKVLMFPSILVPN